MKSKPSIGVNHYDWTKMIRRLWLNNTDMKQSRESIRKMAQLELDILLSKHANPVVRNAPQGVKMLRREGHA